MSDEQDGAGAGGEGGDAAAAAAAAEAAAASGQGGAGGAAAAMASGQGGEGDGGGEGGDGEGGDGGKPWYDGLSDEAPGEGKLSDKAWLENKKYTDLPAVVKSLREKEAQFLSGEKLVIPKEGDPPETFDNFYNALGRPETPDAYEIKIGEGQELDDGFAGAMKDAAHKAGLPQSMFDGMVEPFNAYMEQVAQEQADARAASKAAGMEAYKKESGAALTANVAAANTAMRGLDLDADAIGAIEDGLETRFPGEGTKRTMELFARLGKGMGEDILSGGGGTPQFKMSAANAQQELDKYSSDETLRGKIFAKDPEHTARRKMLLQVVADAESKAAAG